MLRGPAALVEGAPCTASATVLPAAALHHDRSGPISADERGLSDLNVVTPAGGPAPEHDPLPVMFFIHGGGYILGSSATPIYDGAALARRGCVRVGELPAWRAGVRGFSSLSTPRPLSTATCSARHRHGPGLGSGQYRGVRRRSGQRDDLRGERRRPLGGDAAGGSGGRRFSTGRSRRVPPRGWSATSGWPRRWPNASSRC